MLDYVHLQHHRPGQGDVELQLKGDVLFFFLPL